MARCTLRPQENLKPGALHARVQLRLSGEDMMVTHLLLRHLRGLRRQQAPRRKRKWETFILWQEGS